MLLLGLAAVAFGSTLPPAVDPTVDIRDALSPVRAPARPRRASGVGSAVHGRVGRVHPPGQAGVRRAAALVGCRLRAGGGRRVNYLLFPSLYSDYVYTGDLLRLGFYLFLLVGAMREVRSYWESLSQVAVLEDRRRLARDLHDGLTQELTYIWSQSRLLTEQPGDLAVVERINGASARALDEARTAIAALTRTSTGSFAAVLRESVEGLASRYGVQARVEAAESVELSPAQGDAVLRIVGRRSATAYGTAGRPPSRWC